MKVFYINKSSIVDIEKQIDLIVSKISFMKIKEDEKKFLFSQIESIKTQYKLLSSGQTDLNFRFNRSIQSDNCKIIINIKNAKNSFSQKLKTYFFNSEK